MKEIKFIPEKTYFAFQIMWLDILIDTAKIIIPRTFAHKKMSRTGKNLLHNDVWNQQNQTQIRKVFVVSVLSVLITMAYLQISTTEDFIHSWGECALQKKKTYSM